MKLLYAGHSLETMYEHGHISRCIRQWGHFVPTWRLFVFLIRVLETLVHIRLLLRWTWLDPAVCQAETMASKEFGERNTRDRKE